MKNSSNFTDLIKLSPKYLIGISIATGFILFTSDTVVVEKMGMTEVIVKYRIWIGLTFLLSTSLLFAHILWFMILRVKKKLDVMGFLNLGKRRLKNLTNQEKQILGFYIFNKVRTQYLDYTDGTVRELEHANIIYRSSTLSRRGTMFAYNIQPWAWDYLNKHKNLVEVFIDDIGF